MCAAAFWLKLAKLEPPSRENKFPTHYLLKLFSGDGDTSISKGASSEAIHKTQKQSIAKMGTTHFALINSLKSNHLTVQKHMSRTTAHQNAKHNL
jgi:hypothetical protein